MIDIFGALFKAIGAIIDLLRRRPKLRRGVFIISLLFTISCLALYYFIAPYYFDPQRALLIRENTPPLFLVSAIILFVTILSYTSVDFHFGTVEEELQPIRKEREEIQRRLHEEKRADILDTIQLSLNQITEYYTINKNQARRSFSFSVFAIVIGLATLLGGIWLFYFAASPNIQLATISSIAGLLIQFIGGVNFYLYNKSLAQLNYFYDTLIKTQNTMLAIKLCEQIEDKQRQNEVRERLIFEILADGKRNVARAQGQTGA